MGLNKTTITSFVEKFIPSISKKAKTVSQEMPKNKETNFEPNEIIGNFYIKSLPVTGSQKVLNKIVLTRNAIKSTKDTEIKEVFENIYERIINDTSNIENLSDGLTTLLQKVELIENPEIKKEILSPIKNLTKMKKKEFKSSFADEMKYVEKLTDTVNIMNEKYMNIKSEPRELYKLLKNKNSWFTDVIDGKKGTPENYRNGYANLENEKIDYETYSKYFKQLESKNIPEIHKSNLKLEAFRSFIDEYGNSIKGSINKIYLTEYLKNINPEIKEIYKNIYNEYGTMVLSSNSGITVKDAKYLQEELKLWHETGKEKAIFPKIIDINYLDNDLIKNKANGSACALDDSVKLKGLLDLDTKRGGLTLRHELNHINDFQYEYRPKNDFTRLFKFIQWRIKKISQGEKWKKELENAGIISEGHRNYALTNKEELKSVSTEAEMSIFSKKYKDLLVNTFGLQSWVLELPQNSVRKEKLYEDFERNQKH